VRWVHIQFPRRILDSRASSRKNSADKFASDETSLPRYATSRDFRANSFARMRITSAARVLRGICRFYKFLVSAFPAREAPRG